MRVGADRALLRFQDFIDGITVQSQVDEITGLSSTVVLDPKQRGAGGKDLRPVLKLVNSKGKEVNFANTDIPAVYALPAGASGRQLRVVIGGDGPERARLQAAIASHGLAHVITLAGGVDDVAAFLADADLFVLPSRDAVIVRLGPSPRGSDGYFSEIAARVLSALPQ